MRDQRQRSEAQAAPMSTWRRTRYWRSSPEGTRGWATKSVAVARPNARDANSEGAGRPFLARGREMASRAIKAICHEKESIAGEASEPAPAIAVCPMDMSSLDWQPLFGTLFSETEACVPELDRAHVA